MASENEWPALDPSQRSVAPPNHLHTTKTQPATTTTTTTTTSPAPTTDDWEFLPGDSPALDVIPTTTPLVDDACFRDVVILSATTSVVGAPTTPHHNDGVVVLPHAVSTPNLHAVAARREHDAELDSLSYSLVSRPPPWAMPGVSFRDMVVAANTNHTKSWTDPTTDTITPTSSTTATRPRRSPKIVVVATPPRRCSRSTGDLMSLAEDAVYTGHHKHHHPYQNNNNNNDNDNCDDHGVQGGGYSDAMDFYHRKAVGSTARSNGQKVRPDEAARKRMILAKKRTQQRQQGVV